MRWIYLSPHLDDAVLSAGGLIYEQTQAGLPVEIWTLMAGLPPEGELSSFAQVLHQLWGFGSAEESVASRREEDRQAAAAVGARARHFDFPDAVYRRGEDGESVPAGYFGGAAPRGCLPAEGDGRGGRAAAAAGRYPRLPAGIGGHVDHMLARAAAELLGRPLWYDADLPYLFNHPEELEPHTAGLSELVNPVSEAGLEAWEQGIRAYASQLSTVFQDAALLPDLLREYWEPKAGISLWRAEPGRLAHRLKS